MGRITAPKDVHILISGTPEYVTPSETGTFLDELVKDLEMGILSWVVQINKSESPETLNE